LQLEARLYSRIHEVRDSEDEADSNGIYTDSNDGDNSGSWNVALLRAGSSASETASVQSLSLRALFQPVEEG
jgi:hypothetical protein